MLPEGMISYGVVADRVVPNYLTRGDHVWVEQLMEEYRRFVGRPVKLLTRRLKEPLPAHVPRRESRLVTRVLDRVFPCAVRSACPPPAIRAAVFEEAARGDPNEGRFEILARAARRLSIDPRAAHADLYADLPGERRLLAPEQCPTPTEVIQRSNLLLAQSILARSQTLAVELDSRTRPVVRIARLLGLICTVSDRPPRLFRDRLTQTIPAHPKRPGVFLTLSGPLNLFRHTLKYGRALARLLPALAWAPRWRLAARCMMGGRILRFEASHADGFAPASGPPRSFDSKVEERFFKDFQKLTTDWEILREPKVLRAGSSFIFPDFALLPLGRKEKPVLVEVVGFWTPAYLSNKLGKLREAGIERIILCVDRSLACSEHEMGPGSSLVFYKRRIDASEVLEQAEQLV